MVSTFGCCGSVNKRNLMPVNVWKQLRRKVDVSRTSIPVRWEEGMAREAGVRDLVIAWTLWGGGQLLVAYGRFLEGGRRGGGGGRRLPVEGAGEDEQVVD